MNERPASETRLKQAVEFTARMCWRTDPPNSNHKLTDTERLSAIKYHPTIKAFGAPHIELAEAEAAASRPQSSAPSTEEAVAELTDEMLRAAVEAWPQPWEEYLLGMALKRSFEAAMRKATLYPASVVSRLTKENKTLEANCKSFNEAGLKVSEEWGKAVADANFWKNLAEKLNDECDSRKADQAVLEAKVAEKDAALKSDKRYPSVFYSEDRQSRIQVGVYMIGGRDGPPTTVTFNWLLENKPGGPWLQAEYTPAEARQIALHILEKIAAMEAAEAARSAISQEPAAS